MKKNGFLFIATIIGTLIIPFFIPRTSTYLQDKGIDNYAAHRPLTNNKIYAQKIQVPQGGISNIASIIVPYGKSKPSGFINLNVKNESGQIITKASIPAHSAKDDEFSSFPIDKIKDNHKTAILEFTTSEPRDNANVAIRTNLPKSPDISLRLARNTNLYGYLWDRYQNPPDRTQDVLVASGMAVLLTTTLIFTTKKPEIRIQNRKIPTIFIAICLFALSLLVYRISLIDEARGVSGGDPYNFYFIKQRIQETGTFYISTQKRLPVYPIVLMLGDSFTSDIHQTARIVNQIVFAMTLLSLALLLWQLKLPPPAIILAIVFTAINRDFFWVAFRPLAYPLGGFLLLLSLNTLAWAKTNPKRLILASILLGIAAQTRHETLATAGLIAAILIVFFLYKRQWRALAAIAIPATLIVAPYFIANMANHENPIYVGYLDHPVTNPRRSMEELKDHIGLTWGVLGSSWWHKWAHEFRIQKDSGTNYITLALVAIATVPYITKKLGKNNDMIQKTRILATPLTIILFIYWLLQLHSHHEDIALYTASFIFLISTIGILAAMQFAHNTKKTRFLWILTTATAISLFLIGYWIHPVAKQFFSFYPFLGLLTGLGMYYALKSIFGQINWKNSVGISLLLTMALLPTAKAQEGLLLALDLESRKNIQDWLGYNLARHAHDNNLTGTFAAQDWLLPYQYFLNKNEGKTFSADDPEPTPEKLQQENVDYILVTDLDTQFQSYRNNPDFPVAYSLFTFDRDDEKVTAEIIQIPN